jgi:signal transduction histidine kinase
MKEKVLSKMKKYRLTLSVIVLFILFPAIAGAADPPGIPDGWSDGFAYVNGVRIHYYHAVPAPWLTRLINQILDVSKLESGRAEWHESLIDLREVVEDTIAATSQLFKDRNARLVRRLPAVVPKVVADLDRIVQVVLNLLSNAVKFIEPGRGLVEISLTEERGFLRVDVRDNGPGIQATEQDVIFDKFRQAGDTLTGKPQGSGLGMHISRRIVERFGGRMWVSSRAGEGACFSFTLPLPPAREAAPA